MAVNIYYPVELGNSAASVQYQLAYQKQQQALPYSNMGYANYVTSGSNSSTISYGISAAVAAAPVPAAPKSSLQWLDDRVEEMRVKL